MNHVTFLLEHAYAIYSAQPLVCQALDRGEIVTVFVPDDILEAAKTYLPTQVHQILPVDPFQSGLAKRLTLFFEAILVPTDFSATYVQRKAIKWSPIIRRLAHLTSFLKLKKERVNTIYQRLFSLLYRFGVISGLPTKPTRLIAFTKVQHPYLLAPFSDRLSLVMESWDHPMKEPYFVSPALHFAWNLSLAEEARQFQGLKKVNCLQENLKFRYVQELEKFDDDKLIHQLAIEQAKDLVENAKGKYVVYPMCTSSSYNGFAGEIAFLNELSKNLRDDRISLYIRPYPLAPPEDIDRLRSIPGALIGYGSQLMNGADVLDKASQTHKYLLIKNALAIINVGTTFALDAAVIGTPVLQLRLEDDRYGTFSPYSRGVHIMKHLWVEKSIAFDPAQRIRFDENLISRAADFSNNLRAWIYAGTSHTTAVLSER